LIRVAPIVEGHGEVQAVRTLLQRIGVQLLGGAHVEVLPPFRCRRSNMVQSGGELERAIRLASLKLRESASDPGASLILVLLDADDDLPCRLGPELLRKAQPSGAPYDVSCVVANVEYETWFVASAESLGDHLSAAREQIPGAPEQARAGKAWIERFFRGPKYSETVDQPRMTAAMDLALCRSRSPSFDKLCRELAGRLKPGGAPPMAPASRMERNRS